MVLLFACWSHEFATSHRTRFGWRPDVTLLPIGGVARLEDSGRTAPEFLIPSGPA